MAQPFTIVSVDKAFKGRYEGSVTVKDTTSRLKVRGKFNVPLCYVQPGMKFNIRVDHDKKTKFGSFIVGCATSEQNLLALMILVLDGNSDRGGHKNESSLGGATNRGLQDLLKNPPDDLASTLIEYARTKTLDASILLLRASTPRQMGVCDARKIMGCLKTKINIFNLYDAYTHVMDVELIIHYAQVTSLEEIEENPWILFDKEKRPLPSLADKSRIVEYADEIAKLHGIAATDGRRLTCFFNWAVQYHQQEGSTWIPMECVASTMIKYCNKYQCDTDFRFTLEDATIFMSSSERVCRDGVLVTDQESDGMERNIASHLRSMCNRNDDTMRKLIESASVALIMYEDKLKNPSMTIPHEHVEAFDRYKSCDEQQRSICIKLISNKVAILIGGPGTGKSRTLALAVAFLQAVMLKTMVCTAITGVVVDKLKKEFKHNTNQPDCRTMASLLASQSFHGAHTPIAVDELSMVPLSMLGRLSYRRRPLFLLLCGDKEQLPSIDHGKVLTDIMESQMIETVTLRKIYRSGLGSGMSTEPQKLIGDDDAYIEMIKHQGGIDNAGFKVDICDDIEVATTHAIKRCSDLVREYEPDKVQMISNTKEKCKIINKQVQTFFNGIARERKEAQDRAKPFNDNNICLANKDKGAADWVLGDRVINMETRYVGEDEHIKLFNGQTGKIIRVDSASKTFVVRFPSNGGGGTIDDTCTYFSNSISHAYCLTIWKYQGSEIDHVVTCFHNWSMCRELLYTSITRARKTSSLFITENQLVDCRETSCVQKRNTKLCQRLTESMGTKRYGFDQEDGECDQEDEEDDSN